MYTQCPDCKTAFRVTAEVLKQAAGKVRCGGCGNAFNALEYLSEQKPATEAPQPAEPSLPELKPDADEGQPKSASAEQSAALLKTLDELAGSDIRIEDTGVEWRVLDDEDESDEDIVDVFDTRESVVDEMLEESPTPVDQFLTATPTEVEAAEIFEESANGPSTTPVDELRFDDNTPLPEDFDFEQEPATPVAEEPPAPVAEPEPRVDLDLSEPDEWEDILDEFGELGDAPAAPLEAELAALEEDAPPVAEPPVSDEEQELLDMDTQFALQAEAMGIDLSGMHEEVPEDASSPEAEPGEAVADATEAVEETPDEAEQEPAEEPLDIAAGDATQLQLIDEESEQQPPADEPTFGSVTRELANLEEQSDVFDSEFFRAADEVAAELEDEAPDLEADEVIVLETEALDTDADEVIELQKEALDTAADEAIELREQALDAEADEVIDLEADIDLEAGIDLEEQQDLREELPLAAEPYPEDELGIVDEAGAAEAADASPEEPVVPELTEEEQTINMMIDQDLLSMAVEDDDGFASTIIIPGEETKRKKPKKKDKKKRKKEKVVEAEPTEEAGFETIIMEGEHIRSESDYEKYQADAAAAAELVAAARAEDAAQAAASPGNRLRMIGGIVVLVLLLAVQALHQSREALATIPVFNKVVGPVYRAIGQPLSPAWDITGWRIEATKGSIEESDETLVVYSRIGNNSDSPLPYPIINISLTDRFEETLGSRQLDPAEYLPDGLDPSELVRPGNTFNAVISIQSPSPDASGYELDVCYRGSSAQLRCAIADFK